MKLEAQTRLLASEDDDVVSTTAIKYERKQQSGKWTPRHVVVPSKDADTKMKSLKADPKVRNPKVVSASAKVCGCVTASCDHDIEAELTEKQKQLDIDGDGEIDSEDLQRLRKGEKPEPVDASAKKFVAKVFAKHGLKNAAAIDELAAALRAK